MVGNHYRAPFTEKWGGLSYHNVVILSLVTQDGGNINLGKPEVSIEVHFCTISLIWFSLDNC